MRSAEAVAALEASHGPLMLVRQGQHVFQQGDPADRFFNVLSGWVELRRTRPDGAPGLLQPVPPNGFFGLAADGARTETARAITDVVLCPINRNRIDELCTAFPALRRRLVRHLQLEDLWLKDMLSLTSTSPASTRVCHLLLGLVLRLQHRRPQRGERLRLPLTQVQVAEACGLTPVHLNRVLRQLKELDLISLDRGWLQVNDPKAFETLSCADEELVELFITREPADGEASAGRDEAIDLAVDGVDRRRDEATMEISIHRQNLDHYFELLKTESDPRARGALISLLVKEEDRFGNWSQRVDQVDDYIVRGRAQVRQQERILARLMSDGPNAGLAQRALENMREIVAILETYRQGLQEMTPQFP
jgi:CRP-like cAMP-binding protein